jgi:predicted membrane channel-forming protein YqfA (hemolysin III family)
MIAAVDDARLSEPTPDDEARWAAAVSVLERTPTPTAQERLRRHRMLTWAFLGSVVILVAAVAILLVAVLLDRDEPDVDPALWRDIAGLVLSAVGLVVLIVGAVIGWRAGVWRGAWSQPAAVLSRAQRRSLLAQVRGHVPADATRLPLARSVAERMVLQRHLLLFWVGLMLQQVGRAISSTSLFDIAFVVVPVVLYSVATVLLTRDARRAERFLRQHPAAEARTSAG